MEMNPVLSLFNAVTEELCDLPDDRRKRVLAEIEKARALVEEAGAVENLRYKELAESIVENSLENIYALDRDWNYLYVNQNYCRVRGIEAANLIGRNFWEINSRYLGTEIEPYLRKAMEEQVPVRFHAKGKYSSTAWELSIAPNNHGITVFAQDRTEEFRTEQALRESEARYRELFDTMQEVFFVCELLRDENGKAVDYRYLEANPAFCLRARRTRGEVVGHTYRELFRSNPTFETWLSYFDPVEKTRKPVHFEQFAEATGLHFEVFASCPKAGQVAVIMNDITERKKAEEIVQEANTRLQIALNATRLAVHDYNIVTGEIQWDWRLREMWGVGAEEPVTYDVFLSGIHPDDRARIQAAVEKAIDPNGLRKFAEEYRIINRVDQQTYWIYATGQVFFHDGKAVRLVGTAEDITARKQAQEALKASEVRERARVKELEALMDAVPAIIWISRDPECNVITGNKFGYEYLNTEPGQNVSVSSPEVRAANTYYHFDIDGQIVPPEELPVQRVSRTGQPVRDYALDLVFNDGRQYPLFGNANPLFDEEGKPAGAVAVFTDVSQLREMERHQIRMQSQIEMQHRLLDQRERDRQAIARDIHDGPVQTLSSTLFNIQFAKEAITDPALRAELEQIALNVRVATQELRQVISELRPPAVLRFGLSRAIHYHAEDFREKNPDMKIKLHLADAVELSETNCLTLYRIYQEAMNNIARHSGATKVSVHLAIRGKTLRLRIRDNGKGLPEGQMSEDLTRRGHYGMAGMRERAEALNGKLVVTSKPGEGTTIEVVVSLP